jgi:hypothetical protein
MKKRETKDGRINFRVSQSTTSLIGVGVDYLKKNEDKEVTDSEFIRMCIRAWIRQKLGDQYLLSMEELLEKTKPVEFAPKEAKKKPRSRNRLSDSKPATAQHGTALIA